MPVFKRVKQIALTDGIALFRYYVGAFAYEPIFNSEVFEYVDDTEEQETYNLKLRFTVRLGAPGQFAGGGSALSPSALLNKLIDSTETIEFYPCYEIEHATPTLYQSVKYPVRLASNTLSMLSATRAGFVQSSFNITLITTNPLTAVPSWCSIEN